MRMLNELTAELIGMFVAESRMTLLVLAIVAMVGLLVGFGGLDPPLGGAALVLGCLILLIESICRSARAASLRQSTSAAPQPMP
jgi:hypothetical protein